MLVPTLDAPPFTSVNVNVHNRNTKSSSAALQGTDVGATEAKISEKGPKMTPKIPVFIDSGDVYAPATSLKVPVFIDADDGVGEFLDSDNGHAPATSLEVPGFVDNDDGNVPTTVASKTSTFLDPEKIRHVARLWASPPSYS
jgi:hypothetical protein